MKRIAIDSNVVDVIADTPGLLTAIQAATASGQLRIITTHVLEDELGQIPDERQRTRLLAVYAALPKEQVPTRDFVIGKSRLDGARLSDGRGYGRYIGAGTPGKHAYDALIALTAAQDADVLVTREGLGTRNRMPRRLGRAYPSFEVWGAEEFTAYVFGLAAP
jgi:hypothetical protein